ncbi:zinc ribbon domain-containing protein [Bailinhaonella thermotolerans]|uniref:Zinc ribbon domain-containing protein n=1 Tax=Bailinhaonella thermotolerans TaxID=1070861 RepID=A0A3A4A5C1_9ACTN|nr:zinc ribbon domain-containing protein [Bailinhaonella thermotolerans]RJL20533.1 zinc ribbon domain-containing protein [Bailinhaonella thermotolerans]
MPQHLRGGTARGPRAAAALVLAGGLTAVAAPVALAHPHPSGSTDRVTPAAVRVEASSRVRITLLDDRGQIKHFSRTYTVPVASGSGFTVTPDGVVVTATGVVQPSRDPRVLAANKVFAEYFKVRIPEDFSQHTVANDDLAGRLKACYPPQTASSTCVTEVTPVVTVFPHSDPPAAEGLPAEIVRAGSAPGEPAVLRVTKGAEKANLPTAPLAETLGSRIESVNVMAFPGRPGPKAPLKVETAHLDPPGSQTFKAAERDKLTRLLDAGAAGAAVIDNGKSDVVGLIHGGGGGQILATSVEDIRTALTAAGAPPRRGPVDVLYENALAHYHNRFYANSVPVLQQVLRQRPDHAVAAEHLRTALARRGTAQDAGKAVKRGTPEDRSGGLGPWLWPAVGALAVVALAVAVPALMRRRRPAEAAASSPGSPVSPASGAPPPAQPSPPSPPSPYEPSRPSPDEERTTLVPRHAVASPGSDPGYGGGRSSDPGYGGGRSSGPGPRPGSSSGPGPPYGSPSDPGPPYGAGGVSGARHPSDPGGTSPRPAAGGDGARPHQRFCTQCGMRLGQAHQFCAFCGHPADQ